MLLGVTATVSAPLVLAAAMVGVVASAAEVAGVVVASADDCAEVVTSISGADLELVPDAWGKINTAMKYGAHR